MEHKKNFIREVVITSVLDEDPPCVGVAGAKQDTTCLISQMDKNLLASKFELRLSYQFCIKACIAAEMAQAGLNLFLSFYS